MQSRFTTSQLYLRKYLLRILSCLMFKHVADESQNTLRITFFRRFSYQRLYQMMYLTAVKPDAVTDGTIIQLYILILNNQSILMTYRTHHITVFLNSIIRV